MLPRTRAREGHLGWPKEFPGAAYPRPPLHEYDAIASHAIFNASAMRAYVKCPPSASRPPFIFTILREPAAQYRSARDYYDGVHSQASIKSRISIDAHLERIHALKRIEGHSCDEVHTLPWWSWWTPWVTPRTWRTGSPDISSTYRNPQARDLGWYVRHGGDASRDDDEDEISAWLSELTREIDLVLVLERMEEGLVLLQRRLGCALEELASHRHNVYRGARTALSPAQARSVGVVNHVDARLHAHFTAEFEAQWAALVASEPDGSPQRDVARLKALNAAVQAACTAGDTTRCGASRTMDSEQYVRFLAAKRGWSFLPRYRDPFLLMVGESVFCALLLGRLLYHDSLLLVVGESVLGVLLLGRLLYHDSLLLHLLVVGQPVLCVLLLGGSLIHAYVSQQHANSLV